MTDPIGTAGRDDSDRQPDRRRRGPETRARIISAARAVFLRQGFTAATIEEIVSEAQLSRATFYLHFNGKGAVMASLLREQDRPMRAFFETLRDLDPLDWHGVRQWVGAYVRKLRQNRDMLALFQMSGASEDGPREAAIEHRRATIDILAERYPAFQYRDEDPDRQNRRYARCLIHLFPVEQMVNAVARGGVVEDEEAALDMLADHLTAILGRT